MNRDQWKGAAKSSLGRLQRAAGKLVGSQKQQVKGIDRQFAGKAQQRRGDATESVRASASATRAGAPRE